LSKLFEITQKPKRFLVVGDIHGCSEELSALLEYLHKVENVSADDLVVFVGDYVDRGPDSKGVIDRLVKFQLEFPSTIFLKGNHEDMLMDFLGFGGTMGHAYLMNGGADTLDSYGFSILETPEEICQGVPKEHISFLLNLQSYCMLEDYVVAHAGVNPLRDIRAQLNEDLFWIRNEFIGNIHHFRKTIIFGHTPHQDVLFHLPYKIGIDTGLCFGNMLTCVEPWEKKMYQVLAGGKKVRMVKFPKEICIAMEQAAVKT